MESKYAPWVIILTLFVFAGLQIADLSNGGKKNADEPEVLSATTDKTAEERLSSLENRVYILERNTGIIKPAATGKIKEQFVTLTGGMVNSAEWTKIDGSDFVFDASLYGKFVEVSWQGWIEKGSGSVRIYDDTNHRAVDFSEMTVDSGVRSSFYSKPVSIWRGQNNYHLEAKNPNGEISVTSPRLKVVTR